MKEYKFPALLSPPAYRNTDLDDHPYMRVHLWKARCPAERFWHWVKKNLKTYAMKRVRKIVSLDSHDSFPEATIAQCQEIFFQLVTFSMRESENIVNTWLFQLWRTQQKIPTSFSLYPEH